MARPQGSAVSAEEVALRLRRGDSGAVETVRGRVRRILAFHAVRVPADAREDLEQEIMTEVWRAVNRSGFDASRGFWGFVETVTSRRCIDWLRALRVEVELPTMLQDTGPGPLTETLANERMRLAHSVLGRLDAPCRQLIYLQAALGKPYGEIGKILGKSEGALRIQMYRCVRAARTILDRLTAPEQPQILPKEERV